MTKNEMLEKIYALGDDAYLWERDDVLSVDIDDFEGFDENGGEIMRDFTNEDAVDDFIEMLENTCNDKEGDFYVLYHYDGFTVKLGWTSYDI